LPVDDRAVVEREFNKAAILQRADIAQLNATLKTKLVAGGLTFTDTDPAAFRETLKKAGFYSEWKGKFGDKAWSTLESVVGTLS